MEAGDIVPNIINQSQVPVTNKTTPQEIYIRPIYIEMGEDIVNDLNKLPQSTDQKSGMKLLIHGTPQVGKSTFISYLLSLIPCETKFKRILVLAHRETKHCDTRVASPGDIYASIFDFNPDCKDRKKLQANESHYVSTILNGYKPDDESLFLPKLNDVTPDMLIFVDGPSVVPNGIQYYKHLIIFASQQVVSTGSLNTAWRGAPKWTMDTWSKDELADFHQQRANVFPDGVSVDDLMDHFGGAIGYCADKDFDGQIRFLYKEKVERHMKDYTGCTDKIVDIERSDFTSAFVRLVPDENFKEVRKMWLTRRLHETLENQRQLIVAAKTDDNVLSNEGVPKGVHFENKLATSWSKGSELMQFWKVYTNFGEDEWYNKDPLSMTLNFNSPPRIINHKGAYFPTALGKLYRLTRGAEAIDYYLVNEIDEDFGKTAATASPQSKKYRVLLVQDTVARIHTANYKKAAQYLRLMEKTMENVREAREKIGALLHIGDTTSKEKAKEIVDKYEYILTDAGNELPVSLTHDSVEIWLIFHQDVLDRKFDAPTKGTKAGNKATEVEKQLFQKIKVVYAHDFKKGVQHEGDLVDDDDAVRDVGDLVHDDDAVRDVGDLMDDDDAVRDDGDLMDDDDAM